MQTCSKTQRKFTVSKLIGKNGGKLEGKETKATGGDYHFYCVKYSEGYSTIKH